MLRDKEFDVGISSTSERCLATPPKNNLCEFFRVQPTCGQEYRQEYETHTADSVSVSVSYSCLSILIDSLCVNGLKRSLLAYLVRDPEWRNRGTAVSSRLLFTMYCPFLSFIETGADWKIEDPAIKSELSGPTLVVWSIAATVCW